MIRHRLRRRVPVVFQMEAAECGAACLTMVLGAFGRWITLEEARERSGVSRDGMSAGTLLKTAQGYGLRAKALRREPAELKGLPMPQILHWRFEHFVVLEKVVGNTYHLVDPGTGRRTVDAAEMGRSFTGLTMVLAPGPDFRREGRPPSVIGALIAEARRSPGAMVFVMLAGFIAVIPGLAFSGALGVFVDLVAGAGNSGWVPIIVALLLGVALVQGLLCLINEWVVAALRAKIASITAVTSFWHALHLPLAFFAQRSAGEVMSRLRLGAELGGTVAGPLAQLTPDMVTALIYLGFLALYDPVVALAVACVALLNFALLSALAGRVAERNKELQVVEGSAAGIATSGIGGLDAYRMLGREDLLIARWAAAEEHALDTEQRLGVFRAIAGLGPMASSLLLTLCILVIGAVRVMDGSLTLGSLVAAQIIGGLLNAPISALARNFCQLQEAAGALVRLSDLRAHPLAKPFTGGGTHVGAGPSQGRVALRGVSYGHAPGRPVLETISLELAPGRIVGIMGPSGSGKSTFARLVSGLVEPWEGEVTLDGVPLPEWRREALCERLIYVGQNSTVFAGSAYDNIALFSSEDRVEAVREAVAAAGLSDSLARHALGLGTPLSAHGGLSGGEIQRLNLARALAIRPQVLVLDETTSALDAVSEEKVLASLRALGVTVIIVTHRPGTALRCDEIIRLEGGRVAARGAPRANAPTPYVPAVPNERERAA
ncbi:MAG: cysteine peptidase family C39 domain-containing protein [Pseudomonadota bacterium]